MKSIIISLLLFLFFLESAQAGPIAYGICQAGCAGLVVTCYSAAGATFGTVVAAAGAPAAVLLLVHVLQNVLPFSLLLCNKSHL